MKLHLFAFLLSVSLAITGCRGHVSEGDNRVNIKSVEFYNGKIYDAEEAVTEKHLKINRLFLSSDSSIYKAITHKEENWHIRRIDLVYRGNNRGIIRNLLTKFFQIDTLILRIDGDVLDDSIIPADLFYLLPNLNFFKYTGLPKDFDINSFKSAKDLAELQYFCVKYIYEEMPGQHTDPNKAISEAIQKPYPHLKRLLAGMANAPNLRKAYLSGFEAPTPPKELYGLKQIEFLDLTFSDVINLNCDSLDQMENLKMLSIAVSGSKSPSNCLINNRRVKIIVTK